MDQEPFLAFAVENIEQHTAEKLKHFQREVIDTNELVEHAAHFKTFEMAKKVLQNNIKAPEDDFVNFFKKRLSYRTLPKNVKKNLKDILTTAFKEYSEEIIAARLKKAANLKDEDTRETQTQQIPPPEQNTKKTPNDDEKSSL